MPIGRTAEPRSRPLRTFLGSAVLAVGLLGPSSAWAQCTDNFNYLASNVPGPGQFSPISVGLPLGSGSSLSALTSTINTINTAFLTSTSAFVSAPGGPRPDQQGGGVWGRAIGGAVEMNSTSTGVLTAPGGSPAATGTQTCHTTTKQDYWGYQFGHDVSILNGGGTGANWHFGVTAGYFEGRTKDTTPGGSFTNGILLTTPPGSFRETTQVPFAGIYTAFTQGNFFLDAQARWDFYQKSLTDAGNGLFSQSLDARGISVTGNAGYNIPLQNNWFIEPSGGIVWSRVQVDPLSVAGVQQTGGAFFFARGTVTVDDIDSVLGRASLRIGTSFNHAGAIWQPYFTASVFHEFAGDVTATSLANGNANALDGFSLTTTSNGGVGTYGQFALGTAVVLGNTGWLGYGRVDYRVGENLEGWSVNAGLRYQFSPEAGRGSIKDAAMRTAWDGYNWSGLYVGGFVGGVWGDEDWRYVVGTGAVKPDFAGYIAGGQIGYNVQQGRWVVGVEADYGFSNAHGGVGCPNPNFFTCEAELDHLGSLTARLGYTWGRALFYGKGGWAYGDITAQTVLNLNGAVPPSNTRLNGTSQFASGWTIGGGMEFALTQQWSAKAEYMHYDLGSDRYAIDNGFIVDADTRGDTVRVGVNYHFQRPADIRPLK